MTTETPRRHGLTEITLITQAEFVAKFLEAHPGQAFRHAEIASEVFGLKLADYLAQQELGPVTRILLATPRDDARQVYTINYEQLDYPQLVLAPQLPPGTDYLEHRTRDWIRQHVPPEIHRDIGLANSARVTRPGYLQYPVSDQTRTIINRLAVRFRLVVPLTQLVVTKPTSHNTHSKIQPAINFLTNLDTCLRIYFVDHHHSLILTTPIPKGKSISYPFPKYPEVPPEFYAYLAKNILMTSDGDKLFTPGFTRGEIQVLDFLLRHFDQDADWSQTPVISNLKTPISTLKPKLPELTIYTAPGGLRGYQLGPNSLRQNSRPTQADRLSQDLRELVKPEINPTDLGAIPVMLLRRLKQQLNQVVSLTDLQAYIERTLKKTISNRDVTAHLSNMRQILKSRYKICSVGYHHAYILIDSSSWHPKQIVGKAGSKIEYLQLLTVWANDPTVSSNTPGRMKRHFTPQQLNVLHRLTQALPGQILRPEQLLDSKPGETHEQLKNRLKNTISDIRTALAQSPFTQIQINNEQKAGYTLYVNLP